MNKTNKDQNEEGYYFGTAKVGEKGQIVIPKEARDLFEIKTGDTVIMVGDSSKGLYITKTSALKEFTVKALSGIGVMKNKSK